MREYNRPSKKEPGLYKNEKDRFDKGIGELQVELAKRSGPSMRDRPRKWSQLGANYPSGS